MKPFGVLVLLSAAVLLCSAAPDLQPVTCDEDGGAAAARLAMHDINEHHRHGFKFKLSSINGTLMKQADDGCTLTLELHLTETNCPHMSPKHFEDCDLRSSWQRAVVANCSVIITVKSGDATVDRYECDTRQELTEMGRACPDCPILVDLQSPEGLASIDEAINKINKNTSNNHYYILQDVGRILSGYIIGKGMYYSSTFFAVESNCPLGSRITIKACKPLSPDRARHASCLAYSTQGGEHAEPDCEYFPALVRSHRNSSPFNSLPTDDGDNQDPATSDVEGPDGRPPRNKGPPPHAHGPPEHAHGPPSHAKGPPEHAHGPPPHAKGPPEHGDRTPPHVHGSFGPPGFSDHCRGAVRNSDPALHPICPKPLPERQVEPRPSGQS